MTLENAIPATPDRVRAEAFEQRMLDTLNAGALALMISIGHRTGLFDVMSRTSAATSEGIAEEAGLQERYVREWLGAMVTGRIVDLDVDAAGGARRYALPAEHAAALTRDASGNMAVTCQWIPLLGSVEDHVVECFERGSGVPYAAYERFHTVMAEQSVQTVVAALLGEILPVVPGLIDDLERGIDVLDVGCGSGRAINFLARRFPKSRFTGIDLSEEAVEAARREAEARGLGNARFAARDVARLDDAAGFDLITAFDAIHDQARPDRVLAAIARALRPDGVFLMQEIAGTSHVERDLENPVGPFLYTVSCMHCMTLSLAQGGAGLGAMWGRETATRMLREVGFGDVTVRSLPHDVLNHYYTVRR